jgi:hypothetical protein
MSKCHKMACLLLIVQLFPVGCAVPFASAEQLKSQQARLLLTEQQRQLRGGSG